MIFLTKFESLSYAQQWFDFLSTRYANVILVKIPSKRKIKAYILHDTRTEIKKP